MKYELESKNCKMQMSAMLEKQLGIRGMFEKNCLFLSRDLNFKLAQKCSFHAIKELPVARNAKLQPMQPLLGGVTVR